MTTRGDARAWLAWAAAATTLATATRNPVTLLVLLLVVLVVAGRLMPASTIARSWHTAGRLALWSTGLAVLFNVLTVPVGDIALVEAGPLRLTLNALVHGLLAALALLTLLATWAVFNAVVSHGDLLRLTPRPLYLAGVASSIALTFLPGLTRAAGTIGEAQAVRGHRVRGPRDLVPLATPLLSLGLERGLTLAEAMEARGFGRGGWGPGERRSRGAEEQGNGEASAGAISSAPPLLRSSAPQPLAAGVALLAGGGLLLLGSAWPALGAGALAAGGLLTWLGLRRAGPGRSRYRRRRWQMGDTIVVAGALLALAALTAARLTGDAGLDYGVYPSLLLPPVSGWALAAALPLLAPAIAAEGSWR